VQRNEQTGEFMIAFELTEAGGQIFSDLPAATSTVCLHCPGQGGDLEPGDQDQIPSGQGVIEGTLPSSRPSSWWFSFATFAASSTARRDTRAVGPRWPDSYSEASRPDGGFIIVLLFMLIYYRVPGLLADLALILYGLLNLASTWWLADLAPHQRAHDRQLLLERKDTWP